MAMRTKIIIYSGLFSLLFSVLSAETVDVIDKRAEAYYKERKLNKAIAEWLTILDVDPNNERIQRKIEAVYDEKHKKDISTQKARMQLREAKKLLTEDVEQSEAAAQKAKENFIAAYRVDPNDPVLQSMRTDMESFSDELSNEKRKKRLTAAMQKRYSELLLDARQKMQEKKYEASLKIWEEILSLVPIDIVALEGKRQAVLAIENRIKFERIMSLIASGTALFNDKKYNEAKLEFQQILSIDSGNAEAKSYISEINDILDEAANLELRKMQAEQLYKSGIENIRKKEFDKAEDDLENVIAIIEDYKDAKAQLQSIGKLRKEHEELMRLFKLKKIDTEFQNGLIALSESKYRIAISSFETVLSLDKDNALAKRYIQTAKDAFMQEREERVDEDSPYFDVVNSVAATGMALYKKTRYEESRKNWERILNLFPKNRLATEYLLKCNIKLNPAAFQDTADLLIKEGKEYLSQKKYKLALDRFDMIKSISEDYPGIDKLIAAAKKGAVEKTVNVDYAAEIERRIKAGIDYYKKGGKNNLELALQEFKWIINKDTENTSAAIYINKIESQLRVGTTEETETGGRKLTAKEKQYVKTHYFKGINYYFNNKYNDAINEWRKVLAVDPENEKAKMNIRKCLVLLKR